MTSQNQTRTWRVYRMKSVGTKDIATSLKRLALPMSMNLNSPGIMSRLTDYHTHSTVQELYNSKRRALFQNQ